MTLDELIEVFRSRLYLPDPRPLLVVLAAVVANRMPGDPVWVLLVGPPSCGKTELLISLSDLEDIYPVSTATEAGLLSGSLSHSPTATGGLLAEMGKFGIIVLKDFTSVITDRSEKRAALLAAFREIYDGAWVRRLGTDGGRTLSWQGKAGLVGAVTEIIDTQASVIGVMGERFVFFRMPELTNEDRLAHARVAQRNTGHQLQVRKALEQATTAFFKDLKLPATVQPLDPETSEFLVHLSDLATRCRSAVERDPRDRAIELVPQPEAASRLQSEITQLLRALWAIGVECRAAQALVAKVALDGMTKVRRAIVEQLVAVPVDRAVTTADIARPLRLQQAVVERALEDLAAHRVVEPISTKVWVPTAWLKERWTKLGYADDENA